MKSKYAIFFLLTALVFWYVPAANAEEDPELVIAFVSDIKGYLEDCGCPGNVQGGMARRAAFLKSYREQNPGIPLLHLDAGGFSMRPGVGSEHIMRAIIDAGQVMGLDAMNVSELEIYFLQDQLPPLAENSPIPFVSANIVHKNSGEPLFQQFIIIERGGMKIGITGVADHGKFASSFPNNLPAEIADPVEILPGIIKEMRQQCDLIVLMAHEQRRSLPALLKELPPVDVVAAGDGYSTSWQPESLNGLTFSYGGNKGRKVMLLKGYDLDGEAVFQQEIVPMTREMAGLPVVEEIIRSAKAAVNNARSSISFRDEALKGYPSRQ